MSVSKRLRYEVLRRDNHACRYCGATTPAAALTVDHVLPTALGGGDDPANLVAACVDCNSGKSASNPDAPLVQNVRDDAVRWATAMAVAIDIRTTELAKEREVVEWFNARWTRWNSQNGQIPRESGWQDSVTRFFAAGLDAQFINDAIGKAMEKSQLPLTDVWRYFCGVCWRELDKRRELASEIVGAGEDRSDGMTPTPDVPYMIFVEWFLDKVVTRLGGDGDAQCLANNGLWYGISNAHNAYMHQVESGSGTEKARETAQRALEDESAWFLHHLGQTVREGCT